MQKKMNKCRQQITEIPEFDTDEEEADWWDEHGRDVDASAFPLVPMRFEIELSKRNKKNA